MITEKIQCFLFEREIKKFLSLVDAYNQYMAELTNLKFPELDVKSSTIKCVDLFKNKNDQTKYVEKDKELHEMLNTIKKQIRDVAPALFNNVPNNCSIISKNFEIIIEQKNYEVPYSELPRQIQYTIEKRLLSLQHYVDYDNYLSIGKTKYDVSEKKYIIKNKGKIVYSKVKITY